MRLKRRGRTSRNARRAWSSRFAFPRAYPRSVSNDEQHRSRASRRPYQSGKKPGRGPGRYSHSLPDDDVEAECARPTPDHRSPDCGFPSSMLLLRNATAISLRTSCSGPWDDLHTVPRARGLDRDHPGVAEISAEGPDFLFGFPSGRPLDREVMNAGPSPAPSTRRMVSGVVLHDREVDHAVGKDGARYGRAPFASWIP